MSQFFSPIGVFDSGIGGLTVLKALLRHLPHESYVYVGDTARLPYGTKSPETVIRYSEGLARCVLRHDVKAIVVACNTASTHALAAIQALAGAVPVVGMIDPAVTVAVAATQNGRIGVLATHGTIRSGVYARRLESACRDVQVYSQPCQMLVALAEEGWSTGAIAESILRRYLDPIFDQNAAPDTLILGCTHFPVFDELLRKILGSGVTLVNSGEAAAQVLGSVLGDSRLAPAAGEGRLDFFATDDPHRFADNAARFFDHRLTYDDVQLIDVV